MSWGPPGETKYERNAMSKEQIEASGYWDLEAVKEFVGFIKEGDEVYYEAERNNHHGYQRLVGRRPSGLTYCYVISSFMS